jgi:hypothetical protein
VPSRWQRRWRNAAFASKNPQSQNPEEPLPNKTRRTKRSEKGLLTPDNSVVAIIDLQPQMLFGVANFDRQTIINNLVLA